MVADLKLRNRLNRRIDELPVLPTVVSRLMTLDKEAPGFFDELLELIEADPTFAARMLSAANSAASSPRSPITSVRAALARLGGRGASDMILAAAVSRVFVPRDDWERSLWRHSIQVAVGMRSLITHGINPFGLQPDEAYAVGLLHDVGRFVLFGEAPAALRRIDEGRWEEPEELLELERAICGITHGELGQMACRRWGLPESLGEIVLRHHEADVVPGNGTVEAMLATLHFTDLAMFPSALPGTPGYDVAGPDAIELELLPKLPPGMSVSADDLHAVIVTVTAESERTCQALGLG